MISNLSDFNVTQMGQEAQKDALHPRIAEHDRVLGMQPMPQVSPAVGWRNRTLRDVLDERKKKIEGEHVAMCRLKAGFSEDLLNCKYSDIVKAAQI